MPTTTPSLTCQPTVSDRGLTPRTLASDILSPVLIRREVPLRLTCMSCGRTDRPPLVEDRAMSFMRRAPRPEK